MLDLDLRQIVSDPQYSGRTIYNAVLNYNASPSYIKYLEFGYYESRSNNVANFDLKDCRYWTFFYYTLSISVKYIYTGSAVVMCILKAM